MIQTVKQGLEAEGIAVPMTKLCQWFEVPRRSVYYKPTKSAPKVQERLETPIKALIEQDPSYGYLGAQRLNDQRPIINYRPVSKNRSGSLPHQTVYLTGGATTTSINKTEGS